MVMSAPLATMPSMGTPLTRTLTLCGLLPVSNTCTCLTSGESLESDEVLQWIVLTLAESLGWRTLGYPSTGCPLFRLACIFPLRCPAVLGKMANFIAIPALPGLDVSSAPWSGCALALLVHHSTPFRLKGWLPRDS